jgi:hypothetical protein
MRPRGVLCHRVRLLAALLPPLVATAAPPSNPVLGSTPAPFTLEYFASLGCPACERFEAEVLPQLLPDVAAGRLRIVIRDLPAPELALESRALALLCLAPGSDYLDRRGALKRPHPAAASSVTGCSSDRLARSVLEFNRAIFERQKFAGTPAFVLTHHAGDVELVRRSWAGRLPLREWRTLIETVPLEPPTDGVP